MSGISPGHVDAHLARLGIREVPAPTLDALAALHLAHLVHVPFENLDLHVPRPLRLDLPGLVDKVVEGGRGGYCYELNGLFAALLTAVGFEVTQAQCRVWIDDEWSPPFDHLALLVRPPGDDAAHPVLADVGFGDAFLLPQRLGTTWQEAGARHRTAAGDEGWVFESDTGDGWSPQYLVDPTPRTLEEFEPRCRWHETSPESVFRRRAIATRSTAAGRVSISDDRLVTTVAGERQERRLTDPEARRAAVTAWFGHAMAEAVEAAARTRDEAAPDAPTA